MTKYVLFDADDTLVDYRADAVRSFRAALRAVGRESEEALAVCLAFDYGNWDRVGLKDVHLPQVQANFHALYRTHVRDIFLHAEKTVGLNGRAAEAERAFLEAFGGHGTPIEGAMEAVLAVRAHGCAAYAVTNGLTSLQKSRLSAFPLDGVFVSEELGAIKPSPAFFEGVLHVLAASPAECLVAGDSLSSDIAGARAAGIPCVWFNRGGADCPEGVRQVRSLREIEGLL